MPDNEKKIKLMQRLIDLYGQIEFVTPVESRLYVQDHIDKLESELMHMLNYSLIVGAFKNE